jgi:hypothetical protein
MLPPYLIDRIRRQEQEQKPAGIPLHIPAPMPPEYEERREVEEERGVVVIDFSIDGEAL